MSASVILIDFFISIADFIFHIESITPFIGVQVSAILTIDRPKNHVIRNISSYISIMIELKIMVYEEIPFLKGG